MSKRSTNIEQLLRENIRTIVPYSSARSEFSGSAEVFLDANENYRDFVGDLGRNRYPDPLQRELKSEISDLFQVPKEHIFLGNGSDEAIDLLYRAFARPGVDRSVVLPPTYGVYTVFADLNDVTVESCLLTEEFHIDIPRVKELVRKQPETLKLLFICSPNNPTGNAMELEDIRQVLELFPGIVVVDEAYQDFSEKQSALSLLGEFEHLVVLRTLSKAWGLASARLGMAFADPRIINVLTNIKYPYNISGPAQEAAKQALSQREQVQETVTRIVDSRDELAAAVEKLSYVKRVYPSSANFILLKTTNADELCSLLRDQGIIIRNRTTQPLCKGCVRITIGSTQENHRLLEAMKALEGQL
ncbi:MAG: histidinol-phosphate transaminase [Spirochaetota bacterium]